LETYLEKQVIDYEMAIDYYTYGITCKRVINGTNTEDVTIIMDANDPKILKILKKKGIKDEKVKIINFQDLDFDLERGEIKNFFIKNNIDFKDKTYSNNYVTILTTKNHSYDFIFGTSEELKFFLYGLLISLKDNFYSYEQIIW